MALIAVLFSVGLPWDWMVELSFPFIFCPPGEDLKKDRMLPCFDLNRLVLYLSQKVELVWVPW